MNKEDVSDTNKEIQQTEAYEKSSCDAQNVEQSTTAKDYAETNENENDQVTWC